MREQKKKDRNKIGKVAAVVFLSLFLAGCGADGQPSYTKQGMDAVAALDYEKALTLFQTAEENGEDTRLLYRGMGLAYLGNTDYESAIAYLEKALQMGSARVENLDFDINYYLATAYFKNGQKEEAVSVYDAILGLRPEETNAFYLRGCVKLSEGDFEGAQADFDTAVTLDPKNYDQMIRIYMVLEEYGYKEAGQVYLQNAMTENEKSISDYDMGRICYYMGDYENARNFLERLKTTTDYGAALYLGRTYEALGDYNYAASIYAGYVEYDQTKAEIYNQLGLCRMQMGEYETALDAFQTAMNIENNGMMQTLKFNEIVTYEYMGEYKTAAALMNSYLRSYPDDETAKREYEFLQTR
ncbi:MAG: tetratricopeptide repeat protein [Lachnospiraceae bacterium]|nr:tetratricopeptide repeat protein [Lachnospiraceae bacterium]